ncbi:hypothetical protein ACHAXA_006288 [Cyclostephanos tholiformis]|uniref:Uncharacterized protein n=1 Tax=Cyclostephanos tholiformis TaxID=382380 RepID=A0ABD3SP70_9STRA
MHCWSLDPTDAKPLFSCRFHDGRVNGIVYHILFDLIFSVGHDDVLHVSRLTSDALMGGIEAIAAFKVEGNTRLSTLCIVSESPSDYKLGSGSTDGRVIIIQVTASENNIFIAEGDTLEVDGNPMIYSLCIRSAPSNVVCSPSILVGHANGLIEWDLS